MTSCDRCDSKLVSSSMSFFNTDTLCPDCKADERLAPGYQAAKEAELAAVKSGNYNFKGVGLSVEDRHFLAERLAARKATT